MSIARKVISAAVKYFIEGLAVALAAYYLPKRKMGVNQIVAIGMATAATFAAVDVLAPKLSEPIRIGAGLGIGLLVVSK
jgi:EamA domain-containing membrane protein RarD